MKRSRSTTKRVQAKHPLNGLWLTNTTKLHLMQGPITVFDDNVYAGDAKIEDLAPGSQRLLSYALDLDTEVAPESKDAPSNCSACGCYKGTLIATNKWVRTHDYTVKNSGHKEKKVLVEYALDPDWKLVGPGEAGGEDPRPLPLRRRGQAGRASQAARRGGADRQPADSLWNLDEGTAGIYVRAKVVGDKVKAALAWIIQRKTELNQASQKRSQLQQKIQEISEDQGRIRDNMQRLDQGSDLYKRYVKKLSDQEDEVERVRAEIQQNPVARERRAQSDRRVHDGTGPVVVGPGNSSTMSCKAVD